MAYTPISHQLPAKPDHRKAEAFWNGFMQTFALKKLLTDRMLEEFYGFIPMIPR